MLLLVGVLLPEQGAQARTNYTFRAYTNSFRLQLAPKMGGAKTRFTKNSFYNGALVGGRTAPNSLMRQYLRLNRRLVPMRTGSVGLLSTNAPPASYQLTR